MRLTIRLKLLLSSSLLLLAIFAGMTAYLVRVNTDSLRSNLQSQAKAFVSLATPPIADSYNIYADSGTDQIKQAMQTYMALNNTITNVTIVDLQGQQLFSYRGGAMPRLTGSQASSFNPIYIKQNGTLAYVVYPYFSTSGAHPFSILYQVSSAQITSEIHHQELSLALFGTLLLLLTSGLTYLLINRLIVRRVRQVSQQADMISKGNLEQQISIHGHDEIASLGEAVNTMAESLKQSIASLREVDKVKSEFMAITSHNLRTPLTIINGYLESSSLLKTTEDYQKAMSRIGASVKRLGSFAEDVLTISSIELGEVGTQKSLVKIGDFMNHIISETRSTTQMQQLNFTDDVRTNDTVLISEPYLRSAVWNLIDNAMKFTPKDGSITISVTSTGGFVDISVIDSGIGIAADEIPKLFTKFHRATSVVQYDYEGTGIGLYATKLIIEQQGGTIELKSTPGAGSTFTIHLPVAKPTDSPHTDTH